MIGRRLFTFLAPFLFIAGLYAAPPCSADRSVIGTVAAISLVDGTVSVHAGAGDVAIQVVPYTWISRDRTDCSLKNLRVGDHVSASVVTDSGGLVAVSIDARSQGSRKILRGTLVTIQTALNLLGLDLRTDPRADPVLAAVDPATLYTRDGQPAELGDLQIGDYLIVVAVAQTNGVSLATRIDDTPPRSSKTIIVTGIVKTISGQQIIVRTWKDKIEETLIVDPKHGPRKDRKLVSIADLHRGDQIIALGQRRSGGEIDALSVAALSFDTVFNGTIVAVNQSEQWLTVEPFDGGPSINVLLTPATILQVNAQDAETADILIGDRVEVRSVGRRGGPQSATSLDILRSRRG